MRRAGGSVLVVGVALGVLGCAQGASGSDAAIDGAAFDAAPRPDAPPPRPDAAPPCPTAPCDLVDQCGCGPPDVCDIDLDNLPSTHCRPVSSPGREQAVCEFLSDCAGGYVCVGGAAASCKRYCRGDGDCDAPRGQCLTTLVDGTGTAIPGAVVCTSNCDPTDTAAGGCPAGWGCFPYLVDPDGVAMSGDELGIVDCDLAGAGAQGATCASYQDCAPDFLCLGTCAHNCAVGGPNVCPGGTTCMPFATPFFVAGVQYGFCS